MSGALLIRTELSVRLNIRTIRGCYDCVLCIVTPVVYARTLSLWTSKLFMTHKASDTEETPTYVGTPPDPRPL